MPESEDMEWFTENDPYKVSVISMTNGSVAIRATANRRDGYRTAQAYLYPEEARAVATALIKAAEQAEALLNTHEVKQ
jgi:hypothetical protein